MMELEIKQIGIESTDIGSSDKKKVQKLHTTFILNRQT